MAVVWKAALTFGLIAMLAGQAMAQVPPTKGGMAKGVPITLLGIPVVQQELKLDVSQTQKSHELIEATRQKALGLGKQVAKLPTEERIIKREELQRTMNQESMEKSRAFLAPDQYSRLLQLEIQRRGFNAFLDPEITTKLGFTEEQNDKVKTILDEQSNTVRALQRAVEEKKAFMPRVEVFRQETLTKIVGLLTADQKKKWKEMTGEPFAF